MAKKVLGLSFGRKMMNTEIMVKTALMECEKEGCEVKFMRVDDLDIKPCTGCVSCVIGMITGNGTGGCPIQDDFHILEEALYESDAVVIGSPAYVLSPTGKFKIVVDRMGPSHDYSFRRVMYEEGIANGVPEEKLPDKRSFKPRVGALLSLGGAVTENWLSFNLPTMYEIAFPFNIDIIDMYEYPGAMKVENIVLLEDKLERMRMVGQNIVRALRADTEKERTRWRCRETKEVCPVCHCSMLSVAHRGNQVECPVCGITGRLAIQDGEIRVDFPKEEQEKSRLRWGGKIAHSTEIKTCTYHPGEAPDLGKRLKPYCGYAE